MNCIISEKELKIILSTNTKKYEDLFQEGLRLRQNNKLRDALKKFYIYASIESTQFQSFREIFEIMMILKYDYQECFSYLLKPLNNDSIDSIPEQIEYLHKYLKNNKNKDKANAVYCYFQKYKKKSIILSDKLVYAIKGKNFILARQYADLYESCVMPKNTPFETSCLIFLCKSMLDQEEGLAYLLNQQRGCLDLNRTKQVLQVLIKLEFLKESLNISLFLQNKFKNLNFLQVLEIRLKEQTYCDKEYIRRNIKDIIEIYEFIFNKFPAKHQLMKNLSYLLLEIDHDQVQSYSKKYLEYHPKDYQFHFDLGKTYSFKNNKKQAIFHFEKIIEIYIREVNMFTIHLSDIYFNLGECYFGQKLFKKAVYCYQKYLLTLKRGKQFHIRQIAPIYTQLARCYFFLNQFEQCLDILDKSNFSSENISIVLLEIYNLCKNDILKKKVVDAAINISDQYPDCFLSQMCPIRYFRGFEKQKMGQYYLDLSEAIYLKNKIKYDSQIIIEYEQTYQEFFQTIKLVFYISINQLDEAEQIALEQYKKNKQDRSIIALIKIYQQKGDTEKQKAFQNLMNNKESDNLNLARKFMREKQYTQANLIFKNFSQTITNDFSFYKEFGYTQECLGLFEKAIKSYKIFIKNVDPNDTEILYNIGNILLRIEKIKEAKNYFEQCINQNVKFAIAYQGLGQIAKREKEYEKAKQLFEQAISINHELIDSLLEVIDIDLLWIKSEEYGKLNNFLDMARNINSEDLRIPKLSFLLKIKQQQKQ